MVDRPKIINLGGPDFIDADCVLVQFSGQFPAPAARDPKRAKKTWSGAWQERAWQQLYFLLLGQSTGQAIQVQQKDLLLPWLREPPRWIFRR